MKIIVENSVYYQWNVDNKNAMKNSWRHECVDGWMLGTSSTIKEC